MTSSGSFAQFLISHFVIIEQLFCLFYITFHRNIEVPFPELSYDISV
jgi:hypothetical protein